MAIVYKWEIVSLKTKDVVDGDGVVHAKVVCQVYWKKVGTNVDGISGSILGATSFSSDELTATRFTAFDTLTEATVLGWVQSVVTGPYEAHVNSQIIKDIEDAVSPISDSTIPWLNEVVAEVPAEAK